MIDSDDDNDEDIDTDDDQHQHKHHSDNSIHRFDHPFVDDSDDDDTAELVVPDAREKPRITAKMRRIHPQQPPQLHHQPHIIVVGQHHQQHSLGNIGASIDKVDIDDDDDDDADVIIVDQNPIGDIAANEVSSSSTLNNSSNAPQSSSSPDDNTALDNEDLFLLSFAPNLMRMSDKQNSMARVRILEELYKLEFEEG